MRIAIITSSYPRYPGDGTAPFVQSIAQGLADLGNDVRVVAPYDAEVIPDPEERIPVHRFTYIWPKQWHIMGHARSLDSDVRLRPAVYILLPVFLIFETLNLLRVAMKYKAQLIYAHWVLPNGIAAAFVASMLKIPLAISLHGSDVYVSKRNFLFRKVASCILQHANVVTACSEGLYEDAIQLGAEGKLHLVAWGADTNMFKPDDDSLMENNAADAMNSDITIASLGRMVFKKGFHILLQAMAIVIAEYPMTHLIIGGAGPLRESLQTEAKALGIESHVSLPGRIPWDQVPLFLQQSDIFVLPSIQDQEGNIDGLPTVLLEAMSSGIAVIASRIGGVPLVIEHGVNGMMFTPGDSRQLADLIKKLILENTKRVELGNSARKSIEERHTWQQTCRRLQSLFEDA